MPKTYNLQGDAHMKAVFPFITLLWLTGLSCTQALPPTPAPTPTQTSTPVPTPLLTPDIAATVQASVKAAIESVSTAMPIPTALHRDANTNSSTDSHTQPSADRNRRAAPDSYPNSSTDAPTVGAAHPAIANAGTTPQCLPSARLRPLVPRRWFGTVDLGSRQ